MQEFHSLRRYNMSLLLTKVQHVLAIHIIALKRRKCQFGRSECSYLGHVIGTGRVCPELAKIEAIKNFEPPTTKTGVRLFLGLTGYYRKFIPDYMTLAALLLDLTRKTKPN